MLKEIEKDPKNESHRVFILNGLSSFFSISTLIFLDSAALIDVGVDWGIAHQIVVVVLEILVLYLCLAKHMEKIRDAFYPKCMLPMALPAAVLLYYSLRHESWLPHFFLTISLLLALVGFGCLVFFKEYVRTRFFGWYIFSWLSTFALYG